MNEGAVRVALHRLRRRFGEVLRSEIAHTVASPEEVDLGDPVSVLGDLDLKNGASECFRANFCNKTPGSL